jgi:hypothetical protein
MWSVSVEMQFYIFSPFIVRNMYNSEKPWLLPLLLSLISTALAFGLFIYIEPEILDNPDIFYYYYA